VRAVGRLAAGRARARVLAELAGAVDRRVPAGVRRTQRAGSHAACLANLRYGDRADETLDLFPSQQAGAPLLVFVHGGYWQQLSRRESAGPALDLVPTGSVMPRSTTRWHPARRCRRSSRRCAAQSAGCAPTPTRSATTRSASCWPAVPPARTWLRWFWPTPGLVRPARPGRGTRRGRQVTRCGRLRPCCCRASTTCARWCRPTSTNRSGLTKRCLGLQSARAGLGAFGPALCAWGDNETDSFKWQSARFAQALRRAGQDVESIEVGGRNHFDLLGALGDAGSPLGSRVRAWLAGGSPAAGARVPGRL